MIDPHAPEAFGPPAGVPFGTVLGGSTPGFAFPSGPLADPRSPAGMGAALGAPPREVAPALPAAARPRSAPGGAPSAQARLDAPADGSPPDGVSGAGAAEGGIELEGPPRKKRRRGTRGGARRRKPGAEDARSEPARDPSEPAPGVEAREEPAPRVDVEPMAAPDGGTVRKKAKRSRRRKTSGARAGNEVDGPSDTEVRDTSSRDTEAAGDEAAGDEDRSEDGEPRDAEAILDRESESESESESEAARKRRRRGRRGGRRRRKEEIAEDEDDSPAEIELIPGEEFELPELEDLPRGARRVDREAGGARGDRASSKKSTSKTRERKRGTRKAEAVAERAPAPAPVERTKIILVNAVDEGEQRVAVVQGEVIGDFQMTVPQQSSLVNDIYRGRVVNLEPAIGAAFVDFGQGRNGFLHTSDILPAYGEKDWTLDKLKNTKVDPDEWEGDDVDEADDKGGDGARSKDKRRGRSRPRARQRRPITELVKKGQMVVVQVTKEAIGDKGPTLTTYISIPGRYLVLMPCIPRIGVSRKIDDEKERRRLKRILQGLEVPDGMGVIVRTAGVGRKKEDLRRDLDYLLHSWEHFCRKIDRGHGPAPLYQESDVAIRTMRDLFSEEIEAVWVDDPQVHEKIVEFTKKLMPEEVDRIKLHAEPRPLFHHFSVEQDFERIFSRRVDLPSGGSIVFDQTEALVAIDVNSGKTRTDGFDFEDIALKTNLEAVPEIARQIRLRDLGGIIVIDFIDMMRQSNMRTVERNFRNALTTDRARSKLGRISQFGLLELTRQRLGPGMTKKLFHPCVVCRGSGRVRSVESRAAAILRRLGSALTLKGFSKIEVRAVPEVIDYLDEQCEAELRALEHRTERTLVLKAVSDQVEDSVLRYLRADGREVRPGGRRKR